MLSTGDDVILSDERGRPAFDAQNERLGKESDQRVEG